MPVSYLPSFQTTSDKHTLGSLATLGILKLAIVDILVELVDNNLGAVADNNNNNLGFTPEKAARVVIPEEESENLLSCRDAIVLY